MDNPQEYVETSKFLLLPVKIRQMIYREMFSSTTIHIGKPKRPSWKKPKPAADPLAILRTCKLINSEIGDTWLSLVFFTFKIRYILIDYKRPCFREHLELSNDGAGDLVLWALKFLPGLCLDSLMVMDGEKAEDTYTALDSLVDYGHGWKELRFITTGSRMLGFKRTGPHQRKPQPNTWGCNLAKRDGADSGASVTIRRAISSRPGVVFEPFGTFRFLQRLSPLESLDAFGIEEDAYLMQKGEIPLLDETPVEWPGERTWEQIKADFGLYPLSETDDLDYEASMEEMGVGEEIRELMEAMFDLLQPSETKSDFNLS
ncbi:hypothetical protein BDV06DRAFT_227831 [Aspergillus oleicola]